MTNESWERATYHIDEWNETKYVVMQRLMQRYEQPAMNTNILLLESEPSA
jgi:hypothetical protein